MLLSPRLTSRYSQGTVPSSHVWGSGGRQPGAALGRMSSVGAASGAQAGSLRPFPRAGLAEGSLRARGAARPGPGTPRGPSAATAAAGGASPGERGRGQGGQRSDPPQLPRPLPEGF